MSKKILVILGHPQKESLCGSLAEAYAAGANLVPIGSANAVGAEVRTIALGDLTFDPILWNGYKEIQPLEPDLVKAQELITWAEHLVFVYPNWWGTMPALMKGFFDRTLLPNFAFKYRQDSPMWDKLLANRTAQLLVTMDTPSWYYRWIFKMPGHEQMKRTILGFCGIKVVKITESAIVKSSLLDQRQKWLAIAKKLGEAYAQT